jgi:di/tricarboxylate transporter
MFYEEVKHDVEERKNAAVSLVIGGVIAFLAAIFLCLTAAFLLVYVWPVLPMFAAFGIVGGLLAATGGILILVGKTKFDSLHPIAEKSVKALKENVQWTTKT